MNDSQSHWTFAVKAGKMYRPDGEFFASVYSGIGGAKNNPDMEGVQRQGPIPRGWYEYDSHFISPPSHTGPYATRINPLPGTNTLGRGDFEEHGDSFTHPGEASHGCIILDRPHRIERAASEVKLLKVI